MNPITWRLTHNSGHSEAGGAENDKNETRRREADLFWPLIGALALVSTVLGLGGATPDVAWLIDMCERIARGETAYIDIFETTPPVPTLIYMPGVWIEQATVLDAAAAVHILTALTYLAVLAFTAQILPRRLTSIGRTDWHIIAPAALFLFALSTDAFAQRETIAAALMLPSVAVFVRRAKDGHWPAIPARLGAAMLGGLAVAIKPPLFAAPYLALGAYYVVTTRSVRGIYSSGLAATGAISVAITAASLLAYPDYLGDMTVLMREIYVPLFRPFGSAMIASFIGVLLCFGAGLLIYLKETPPEASRILGLFTLAFVAIFVAQGKFFTYHAAPAALFGTMTAACLIAPRVVDAVRRRFASPVDIQAGLSALILLIAFSHFWFGFDDRRFQMRDMSWAESLDRPTAMAVSTDISIGFPLARRFDAQWIDRIHSQWVSLYARIMIDDPWRSPAEKTVFRAYQARDIARTIALIKSEKPEIIIHCVAPASLWLTDRMLAEAPDLFDGYAVIAAEGPTRVLRRIDIIEKAGAEETIIGPARMSVSALP
ncbi:MAG: hypothetical protein AAFY22_00595 [Pseudomonadota bacterium]